MTLTFELHLDSVKINQRAKASSQSHTHTHTHTHMGLHAQTRPIALQS